MPNEQNDEVSDTTGDAQRTKSWFKKIFIILVLTCGRRKAVFYPLQRRYFAKLYI